MKKKTNLVMGGVLLTSLMLGGCTMEVKSPETATKLPQLTELDEASKHYTAVVFVTKGHSLGKSEAVLAEYGKQFNIPIKKIDLNLSEDSDAEVLKMNEMIETYSPIVAKFQPYAGVAMKDANNGALFQQYMDDAVKESNPQKKKKLIALIASLTKTTEERVEEMIAAVTELTKSPFLQPLDLDAPPFLVLFRDNLEMGRIQGLNQNASDLQWLLTTKGLRQLDKTDYMGKLQSFVDTKHTGIVAFEKSDCPYCKNTTPLLKEMANEEGLAFEEIYVDTLRFTDDLYSGTYKKYIKENVEVTPTYKYYKKGKEVGELKGERSYAELGEFISKMKRK